MNTIKIVITLGILAFMSACADTVKFPVSEVVPASDITAKVKKQGEPNYLITIEANNLASPERLQPPKKIYVIWAVSEAGIVRNTGHFTQKNAEKSTYKASFPYQPVEIFITAENEEGNCSPTGTEISRAKIINPKQDSLDK